MAANIIIVYADGRRKELAEEIARRSLHLVNMAHASGAGHGESLEIELASFPPCPDVEPDRLPSLMDDWTALAAHDTPCDRTENALEPLLLFMRYMLTDEKTVQRLVDVAVGSLSMGKVIFHTRRVVDLEELGCRFKDFDANLQFVQRLFHFYKRSPNHLSAFPLSSENVSISVLATRSQMHELMNTLLARVIRLIGIASSMNGKGTERLIDHLVLGWYLPHRRFVPSDRADGTRDLDARMCDALCDRVLGSRNILMRLLQLPEEAHVSDLWTSYAPDAGVAGAATTTSVPAPAVCKVNDYCCAFKEEASRMLKLSLTPVILEQLRSMTSTPSESDVASHSALCKWFPDDGGLDGVHVLSRAQLCELVGMGAARPHDHAAVYIPYRMVM